MVAVLILWGAYVLQALAWSAIVVAILAAIVIALGVCRMAALSDGTVTTDREIDP